MRSPQEFPADAVALYVAFIERPAEDEYLNQEIWRSVDQLVLDFDRKALLEENGIRTGVLLGTPPVGFQTLLLSKRFCANPEKRVAATGRTQALMLSPVLPHGEYTLTLPQGKETFEFDRMRYCLDMKMERLDQGRVKLTFTPKVETGETALPFEISPEEGFTVRVERPHRLYPALSWDVTLETDEYVLIGGRMDRSGTFGQRSFGDDGDRQRLLVIRNATPSRQLPGEVISSEGEKTIAPLAVQASTSGQRFRVFRR